MLCWKLQCKQAVLQCKATPTSRKPGETLSGSAAWGGGCSVTQSCLTLCDPVDCSMLSFPVLCHLPEFTRTHVHWVSDAIHCHPLLLLPSIFPRIRVFSKKSAVRIRWPKYWSFNFSISSSNEYSEVISFTIDWFDLLAVQGTLKSLLQHHSSKASILQHSAFFMAQLSHIWLLEKPQLLTIWSFVGKSP